jgi:hypothetical protein
VVESARHQDFLAFDRIGYEKHVAEFLIETLIAVPSSYRLKTPRTSADERVPYGAQSLRSEGAMEEKQMREEFDTGLSKIRHEIKSRLVPHGLFGSVTFGDIESVDRIPTGSKIEITVKGRTVERSFTRQDVESCRLRVGGVVLLGIVAMVDELST